MKEYKDYTLSELQTFKEQFINTKPKTIAKIFTKIFVLGILETLIKEKQQDEIWQTGD